MPKASEARGLGQCCVAVVDERGDPFGLGVVVDRGRRLAERL